MIDNLVCFESVLGAGNNPCTPWDYPLHKYMHKQLTQAWVVRFDEYIGSFQRKKGHVLFFILEVFRNVIYILLLTHRDSEYLSWSCKALNFELAQCYISITPTGNVIMYALGPY